MSLNKINIVVAGATGYVGLDLINILSRHLRVNIKYLCAKKKIGKNINYFDKRIKKKLPKITKLELVNWSKINVLFTCLPAGESQVLIKSLIKYRNLKIIDLSADFRLNRESSYKKYYGSRHKAKGLLKFSIYSLTEFVKKEIKKYKIIACPGCYPTSIQLPLIPLLKMNLIKKKNIIIDSKSGYSGAGKNLKEKFTHKNLYSSIHAYGVHKHRHTSEIDQEFSKISNSKVNYTFVPHLIPTFRGMLSTIYVEKTNGITTKKIYNELKKYHKKNYFIKITPLNKNLGTENVLNTNFCEISLCSLKDKNKLLILSAIDNLVKGAAGQAVQNMNVIFGYKENLGLL
jgi:N-acetyl-gamma-glutamyl-phosphate reductase